jgi:hypothetical protein
MRSGAAACTERTCRRRGAAARFARTPGSSRASLFNDDTEDKWIAHAILWGEKHRCPKAKDKAVQKTRK